MSKSKLQKIIELWFIGGAETLNEQIHPASRAEAARLLRLIASSLEQK